MAIFVKKPLATIYESELTYERISLSKNGILQSADFRRKKRYGYDGYLFYNVDNNLVGFYWYSISKAPPTSIPKIPNNSVWIFNMLVFEKYRGKGYQKEMLKHFDNQFQDYENLYSDILFDNIPSIKSFLKMGYQECGIYHIIIFGIRRYRFLNLRIGYWDRNRKHQYTF